MAGLHPSFNLGAAPFEMGSSSRNTNNERSVEQLVLDLCNSDLRENAMLQLSKKRELFQELAPLLWNSAGTIAALLQEIICIYPFMSLPTLAPEQSYRVCNALTLLQCLVAHQETRMQFLRANIPHYICPFLNPSDQSRQFEFLRLASLGVIGELVKVDDKDVISFLLSTEIVSLCLRIMETGTGSEFSKTMATFIVQKILLDEAGLEYFSTTPERFFAVSRVLGAMVAALTRQPSNRLLQQIIRCYLRLSDNPRGRHVLRSRLPPTLGDATFNACLHNDPTTRGLLQLLLQKLHRPHIATLPAAASFDHFRINRF